MLQNTKTPLSFAPPRSPWLKGLVTWLAYTLSGIAALSLAPLDDDVSPLYLAAGIGLGAVLGWGRSMVLAVGLGSATVAWAGQMLHHQVSDLGMLLVQGVVSGVGAGLQAWLAARLVQPLNRGPLPLDKPAQIGRFLLLAGPVACVVNASLSVGSMVALGILPLGAAPSALGSWWLGDTLGVVVGTPLMLTLVGRPADLWRARRLVVGLPLLMTTVLLALSIRQVQLWESEREAAVFTKDVAATANAVRLRLNGYLDALEALHGVYVASREVSREEFKRASAHWIQSLDGIQALGWEELLKAEDLPAFEARQQAEGVTGYRVFDAPDRRRPQGRELAVVRFVEPPQGNEAAMGYNVLSSPAPRSAFEQARRENRAVVTRGFRLAQERGQQRGVAVYRPVYRGEPTTPQARVLAAQGAVFMALRMDDALGAMLQGLPGYLQACLFEEGQPPTSLLAGAPGCRLETQAAATLHRQTIPLDFAGANWQLVISASGPVPLVGGGATSWLLAIGGVGFAASLGALLLVMTGHARRIEAAMNEAREQRAAAEAANRAKSEFLSRMSHELRTPLNAVLGFAQVMELDQLTPLPPAQKPRIQQIQQAGWHLLDMIDDVLDISRIDTGAMRLQAESLSVREALAAAGAMLEDQATRQGISVHWPRQVPADWGVRADPTRLRQVLTNLLSNAIKYNRPGGTVTVSVQRLGAPEPGMPGRTLQIAVSDTGLGMNPEQLAQLFEPFNRLGRERAIPDGTGIGLVISQHLAALMGGELSVQSLEGQGSTFTLTLPAVTLDRPPQALQTEPEPGSPPAPADGRPRHVLYVEDNLANAEVMRAALSERPWVQLSVAASTEAGLAVLHDRLHGVRPELILLDVHLPDASGQELLKLIKANPDTAGIPVIMISADATPEQIDAALSAGACCYLTKPVQLAALLRQVDELLLG